MTGARVYTSTSVTAPAATWLLLPLTPVLAGGEYSLTVTLTGPARFFRLELP